jgi:hypothetical protein
MTKLEEKKDAPSRGEVVLDALAYIAAHLELAGLDNIAEITADLCQVAENLICDGPKEVDESACGIDLQDALKKVGALTGGLK